MGAIRDLNLRFWSWYQRHYLATLVITTTAFLLQIFHLYWLFAEVIMERLTGRSWFVFPEAGMVVYVLADYLEIPALISASVLYLNDLRKGVKLRGLLFLLLLNTQWVHMLWITDDVVVRTFAHTSLLSWGAAVAWVAILIDYLELPVIVDTLRRVFSERRVIWRRVRRRFGPGGAVRPAPSRGCPSRGVVPST